MVRVLERLFEAALWRSRWVVLAAVIASMAAAIAVFYLATVDVVYLVAHMTHYAEPTLGDELRRQLHDQTISHVVEVVDAYLIATFMLIFSLGTYELFISDIDEAKGSRTSSRILVIESLDDLKARLAKVILMILIVTLFEHALNMKIDQPVDLLYLGAAIAMIGLALYLTHASESHKEYGRGEEGMGTDK
ncbi:MAG TPA: YqhA family protein [Thiobacillaceae bacterium]|nr:YqhA family protein [Thiobacillaceae bacterium]